MNISLKRKTTANYYVKKSALIDHYFVKDIERGTKTGDLTYTEAFNLLGVKNNHAFDELIEVVNGS